MSVDTKIHIPLQYDKRATYSDNATVAHVAFTIQRIKEVIEKKLPIFKDVTIRQTIIPEPYDKENDKSRFNMYDHWDICFALNYPNKEFESGKEQRRLWSSYDHYSCPEMIYLSIGAWGHNEDIAKCLVNTFGGYADFSDCDSIIIDYARRQPKPKTIQKTRKAKLEMQQ